MKGSIFVMAVLLLLGSAFLYLAYLAYSSTAKFLKKAEITLGEVVRYEERWSRSSKGGRSKLYYPVINFQARNGERISFESSTGSGSPPYKIGENIKIAYNPGNPQTASIYAFFDLWFVTFFFGLIGINLFAIGVFIFLSIKRL